MSTLKWDGLPNPSRARDQILRRDRGQENIHFPCSADYEQDWQPYPVDLYSCYIFGDMGDREIFIFPVQLADHEQDWQPYPVDPYCLAMCDDHTYMCDHTYINLFKLFCSLGRFETSPCLILSRFSLSMEMSRLTRDRTAEPVSRVQILRHARGQGNIIFPFQLTTSRIGNLTRLIHTLLYVMTIHPYIQFHDPVLP